MKLGGNNTSATPLAPKYSSWLSIGIVCATLAAESIAMPVVRPEAKKEKIVDIWRGE